jgi:hypothetical protein
MNRIHSLIFAEHSLIEKKKTNTRRRPKQRQAPSTSVKAALQALHVATMNISAVEKETPQYLLDAFQ